MTHLFSIQRVSAEQLSGVLTVLLVASIDIWLMLSHYEASTTRVATLALLYALFSLMFFLNTQNEELLFEPSSRWVLLIVQYVVICIVMYTTPQTFAAILLVIWMAQLPYFLSFKWALWTSPIWSIVAWTIFEVRWETDGVVITGLLFFAFTVFSLIMMESRKVAEFEKERAETANRELIAMQSLLDEASKHDERLRIARDIHDLVGHHLTALTVQLQVLGRTVPEASKAEVERSHAIAKLLLSDVRSAVSDIREHDHLDLRKALTDLVSRFRGVQVNLSLPERIAVLDLDQGVAVLRGVQEGITNAIRHGKASKIEVSIQQDQNKIDVEIVDNGRGALKYQFGSGLKGMKERIHSLQGELKVNPGSRGFLVFMSLPLSRKSNERVEK